MMDLMKKKSSFKEHPSYKEFEHKGVKVCEVFMEWGDAGVKKLMWVRESFELTILDNDFSKPNPIVHKDVALVNSAFAKFDNQEQVERARAAVREAFEKHWGLT